MTYVHFKWGLERFRVVADKKYVWFLRWGENMRKLSNKGSGAGRVLPKDRQEYFLLVSKFATHSQ